MSGQLKHFVSAQAVRLLLLLVAAAIASPADATPTVAWAAVLRGDPEERDATPYVGSYGGNRVIVVDGAGNTLARTDTVRQAAEALINP